jgi:DnaJ-class molecular chaperone
VNDIFGAFGDLFEQFGSGGGGGGSRRSGASRGESLQTKIRIDLTEAFNGCKRELRISRHEACDTCQGSGCKPGTSPKKCTTCGGQGQVIQSQGFLSFKQHVLRVVARDGGERFLFRHAWSGPTDERSHSGDFHPGWN